MVVVLCLLGALAYGLSDFAAGVVSRRVSPWSVAVTGQGVGSLAVLAVALAVGGSPTASSLGWAALAGVGNGVGTAFLYRGLAAGRMGVVGPVSAVGAALVPVAVGLAAGERPGLLVTVGLLVAAPAIWLVAGEPRPPGGDTHRRARGRPGRRGRGGRRPAAGLLDGVVAGLGFGVLFAALAQVPESAGLVPLAANLAVGTVVVVLLATGLRAPWWPREAHSWWGGACGLLGALATGLFLVATRDGELTVAAVVVSLYPAFTVLLAAGLLREPIHRTQAVGLALCAVTVSLVAAG